MTFRFHKVVSPLHFDIARRILILVSLAGTVEMPRGETVQDREGAVRSDAAAMSQNKSWIYNDIDRGFAEAKRANKPLLVVLRCVPCKACMGIDASILNSPELKSTLAQFVKVRVINANGLDLSRFQFDYDLSFSTMVFNGDGTVYGRYGSWQHQRNSNDATTAGYKAALDAALEIHTLYPANRDLLSKKQGAPSPYKVPVEIPGLAGKYGRELNWTGKVVQSCVHCHQIGEALRTVHRSRGEPIPLRLIYPMPAPETIGIYLDPQSTAHVVSVVSNSAADAAGIQTNDKIVSIDQAPIVSVADVAWALHQSGDQAQLEVVIRRDQELRKLQLHLKDGWRQKSDISGRAGIWSMRAMVLGGLVLEDLSETERKERNLSPSDLALRVKMAGEYGMHAAAKKAGFKKDDVIVTIETVSARMTESELIGYLLRAFPKPTTLKARVMRDNDSIDLKLPIQ